MNAPIHIGSAEYDVTVPRDEAVLLCARIVHVAVEALNAAHNESTIPWEQNRASIVAGVERALANPGETPEQNHEAWMRFRAGEGWTYGPVKDPVRKTHPCMVPYAALGPFQRSKDAVFQAIVRAFFGLEEPAPVEQDTVERPRDYDAPQALAELDANVTANFKTRYGAPRSTISDQLGAPAYRTYLVGAPADGDKNWWPELADHVLSILRDLKRAGAVELVWRLASRFQAGVGDGYLENQRICVIRTRFAALDADGREVVLDGRYTPEGDLMTRLDKEDSK